MENEIAKLITNYKKELNSRDFIANYIANIKDENASYIKRYGWTEIVRAECFGMKELLEKMLPEKIIQLLCSTKPWAYDRRLAGVICDNPKGIDGVEFYSTKHPTFSNLLENTALDEVGLKKALDTLVNNTESINLPMGSIYLVVPNRPLLGEAIKLINTGLYGRITPLFFPELNKGSTRSWYLMHDTESKKPFTISYTIEPTAIFDFNSEGDLEMGSIACYGVELTTPELSVKAIEP